MMFWGRKQVEAAQPGEEQEISLADYEFLN